MFSILRPFLFNLDPETAHDLAIKSLKFDLFPSKIFEIEDEQILNIELLGKKFPNPIGLAAGFDKSAEAYKSLWKLGFGLIEVGTITPKKQPGKKTIHNIAFCVELTRKKMNLEIGTRNNGSIITSYISNDIKRCRIGLEAFSIGQ